MNWDLGFNQNVGLPLTFSARTTDFLPLAAPIFRYQWQKMNVTVSMVNYECVTHTHTKHKTQSQQHLMIQFFVCAIIGLSIA